MGGRGSVQLARLFGIRVGADYSWFVILFLAIFFARQQLAALTDASDTAVYLGAVGAAFLFFASIIAHEMGHALAARREGIAVAGIDLFLFGGLMHMRSEPSTPGGEFRVAAAGPAVTALVIVLATAIGIGLGGADEFRDTIVLDNRGDLPLGTTMVSSVALINLLVLVFNLIPAYPLDGGRIARAAVWKATGDRHRATRAAALVGRAFGGLLIVLGVVLVVTGQAFNGVYIAFLGWLLSSQARGVAVQSAVTERLEGVTVADLMDPDPVAVPADLPAARAHDEFFLRYGYDAFPVVEADGGYVGRLHRDAVREDDEAPVRALALREETIRADETLEELLRSEPLGRHGTLVAVDAEGRLRGVITGEQVARALRNRLVPSH